MVGLVNKRPTDTRSDEASSSCPFLTCAECAAEIGKTSTSIQNYIKRDLLSVAKQVGRSFLISRVEWERFKLEDFPKIKTGRPRTRKKKGKRKGKAKGKPSKGGYTLSPKAYLAYLKLKQALKDL